MKIRVLFADLILILLCGSAVCQTAEPQHPFTAIPTSVLARLSLQNALPAGVAGDEFLQVCFAVDGKGDFLLWRITSRRIPEAFEGTLAPEKLKKLRMQLAESNKAENSGAVILRHDGRSFVLELPSEKGMSRKAWVAERAGDAFFPKPVESLAHWIYHFNTEAARPLTIDARSICPRGDVKPLQPATM
jgi:hypothetical protein